MMLEDAPRKRLENAQRNPPPSQRVELPDNPCVQPNPIGRGAGPAAGLEQLVTRISDRYVRDPKQEGWLDAPEVGDGDHPRAIRTVEHADHFEALWGSRCLSHYRLCGIGGPTQMLWLSGQAVFRPS